MKRATLIALSAVLLLAFAATSGRSQKEDELGAFMRAKLLHSQKILEGLTTEDYDMIAKHSQELSLLSQAASWQVLQTPEYMQHSAEFRRSADSLTEAAKNKNIDGAALAYVEVTFKCVNCHKYVRRVRMADAAPPSLSETAAASLGRSSP
ncbi:MAG: hypothetical protein RIC55_12110 [Pirellulaceae bacterium]